MIDLKKIDIKAIKAYFKKRPERMGLEFEGRSARIVRLKKSTEGAYSLGEFGEVEYDSKKPTEAQRQELQLMLGKIGAGLDAVAVNIEDDSLRLRRMVFAKMPDGDLLEAIRWNFREHIEVPIEDYSVGYLPLVEELEGNKIAVVGYGVSKASVDTLIAKVKSLGYKAVSLEPVASAMLMALHMNGVLEKGLCHCCISFGNAITHFGIYRDNELLFSRPLAHANHESLIHQIVRDANVEEGAARDMLSAWIAKKTPIGETTSKDAQPVGQFQATVKHFFSQVVIEIQRSIDAFCILYGIERVDRIHICGFGISYPDLVAHIQRSIGIDTRAFNPFGKIADVKLSEDTLAKAPKYAVAVGLAFP